MSGLESDGIGSCRKVFFFFFYEKKIMNEKDSNFLKNLNKRIKKYDTWNLN